ncbi:tetratricopeptide repeat protein, partial [Planctomycetota bacterium]
MMQRIGCVVLLAVILIPGVCLAGPRDEQWRQAQAAIDKGLPLDAIATLEQIIPAAIAEEAYAEAIKAISFKIVEESKIQGNKPEEKITRLQDEMTRIPPEMAPVMEAILAHWYWQYFQQNRWRFVDRSQTSETPGDDFTTWDLSRLLAEIDRHFVLALAAEQNLQTIPIDDYDDLLERGSVPDSYRPTLYDFLAHEALSFYNAGEQAGALPFDTFEILADSPIFGTIEEFLLWQPQTVDTDSPKLKAVRLYQALLNFHRIDGDQTAFIDADLHRLTFGHNQALGPDKDALYIAALARFVNQHAGHEISARALHTWARAVHGQGDYEQAHDLAYQGWQRFPASIGGAWCYNLTQQIETRSLTVKTERVWNAPWPDIQVTYRNVTRVHFR